MNNYRLVEYNGNGYLDYTLSANNDFQAMSKAKKYERSGFSYALYRIEPRGKTDLIYSVDQNDTSYKTLI